MDLILSLTGFILFFPFFILITVLLLINNHGKAFFTQIRPGKNEVPFKVIKFKTMNDQTDLHGTLLADEARLTSIGKIVRKTSMDEIPQLLNVIKGEMSLIGPRPLLAEYISLYTNSQKRRHEVRPGITGWAQINGRNTISWAQKFEFDIYYVENLSFELDLKILFITILKIFKAEGISGRGVATAEKFDGKN